MKSFRIFKHGTLTITEVPLTEEEVRECLELGKKRTEVDEEELKWWFRHNGLSSPRAHAIGLMGEIGFEKWLNSKGLKRNVDYVRGKTLVRTYAEIEQDFTIWNKAVGVKSADNNNLEDATKFGTFLYPAKIMPEEAIRVLPYPKYLVQTVVSTNKKTCWLCGYVDEETIKASSIAEIHRKPTHRIAIEKYGPVDELLKKIKT